MLFDLTKLLFMNISQKVSTKEAIVEIVNQSRKRIDFATSHANALKKTPSGKQFGLLKLPFRDSIGPLMQIECAVELYDSSYEDGGVYRYVNEEEFNRIAAFIDKYREVVFLRDTLEMSLALSINFNAEDKTRTEVGEMEFLAKYRGDEKAADALAERCRVFLSNTPFYQSADYLLAMPSTRGLPARVASRIVGFSGTVLTDKLSWRNKEADLKNADNADKVALLDKSGFVLSEDVDVKDKVVILLDDLYKSGVTMQYVAMKLKEAGASMVLGLSLVKSLSDKTDQNDSE